MDTRRPGGARFGSLLLLLALGACWGGGQGTYTALRYSEPTSLTMDEYVRSQPESKWLELNDAYVNVLHAAHLYRTYADSLAPTDRIYIPVYPSVEAAMAEVPRVVLETTDPDLVGVYNALMDLPEDQVEEWLGENWERIESVRTVMGTVRFGFELDSEDRDLLRAAFEVEDFILLADGQQPELGFSVFMLLIGAGFLGFGARQLGRAAAPEAEETAEQPITALG